MAANSIEFVTQLIYGDMGASELGTSAHIPASGLNHIRWTLEFLPNLSASTIPDSATPTINTNSQFLVHHLDYMLQSYEEWRSKYFLPPLRPWNGQDMFPGSGSTVGPTLPTNLNGSPFPAGWTENDLGTALRTYYNNMRHFSTTANGSTEMNADEIKAPYSFRYWEFLKWMNDLRKRLNGQPVLPVSIVYDKDGTILSDKDFTDIFHQVHHVWHPNCGPTGWTTVTPYFKSSVGQHRRKKQISRTQVGSEFFEFHRDHLILFDRWLARTNQVPIESLNTCNHDTSGSSNIPAGIDIDTSFLFLGAGIPTVDWNTNPPTADLNPHHHTYWNGDLMEFRNLGLMGQLFATDNNGFISDTANQAAPCNNNGTMIPVAGATPNADRYHGIGHVTNGDIIEPVTNNHVPRFFAWHGYIDDLWTKRSPDFNALELVLSTNATYPEPKILTIVRDFNGPSDSVEPSNAIQGINRSNGQGTLKLKLNVRKDPFGRELQLKLRCDVLRENVTNIPVISITRDINVSHSQQNSDFIESFVFDGSAGTTDSLGFGPFLQDNALFTPKSTGFTNSLIRITAHLSTNLIPSESAVTGTILSSGTSITGAGTLFTSEFSVGEIIRADGQAKEIASITSDTSLTVTTPFNDNLSAGEAITKVTSAVQAVSGTISTSGTALTGVGTAFTSQFVQGDLIRANGQVRTIALINSNTSITLINPFDANLAAGTSYELVDGFVFEKVEDLQLIQEKDPPIITTYLDRSSFSKDQVDATSSGGQSVFDNAFYVILQDDTDRAGTISWPAEVEPKMRSLIAPPIYAAGLYTDSTHEPDVVIKDLSDNVVSGILVDVTSTNPESPSQHPAIPQRITHNCRVTFTNTSVFAGMGAGDIKDLKLVVTAIDRAGNEIIDDTKRIRLHINANPYMLDGPTSWLSMDTRVFKVQQGQARFGVASGWSDPYYFIQQTIGNFRTGNGTAGGESFDNLPQDQAGSVLEYSTSVNGINYFNFALSKMRLQSQTGATNVRATFRLFRWGTANVEFDRNLAYQTSPSGVGLLGRTSTNGLASIPFFSQSRKLTSEDMNLQVDTLNATNLPASSTEATSFFGAYLDINQNVNRFPSTYTGDGPFSGPLSSIRNLLMGHHQCMVVEVVYTPDLTADGATPGTSDNLSQRNLLIVQTANPGDEITRSVQHLFDIDLTRKRKYVEFIKDDPILLSSGHGHHSDGNHEVDDHNEDGGHFTDNKHLNPAANCCPPMKVLPAFPNLGAGGHAHHSIDSGWHADFPEGLEILQHRAHKKEGERNQWRFDKDKWKPGTGLDELAFHWNNLPPDSIVEVYFPGLPVTEIFNYRNLRHAPGTVKIVNENTLRLFVEGVTYLPIPPFYGDNVAGLITVKLPKGIKKGQRFAVDVIQIRTDEAKTLGGFQLNIQVEKAYEIVEQERTWLELFHRRFSLMSPEDRWHPIAKKQLEFTRGRAEALVDLANEEDPLDKPREWIDPTFNQKGKRLKLTLNKIQILDDQEPFFKGKGEFRFYTNVFTPNNGGITKKVQFPEKGCYRLGDCPDNNEVEIKQVIFDNFVEDNLFIEIGGLELDTFDPSDQLTTYKRIFEGQIEKWIGNYHQHDGSMNLEHLGSWKVWYSLEYSG